MSPASASKRSSNSIRLRSSYGSPMGLAKGLTYRLPKMALLDLPEVWGHAVMSVLLDAQDETVAILETMLPALQAMVAQQAGAGAMDADQPWAGSVTAEHSSGAA